ncbi:tRNA-specific adenosine deaminase [Mariniplasma anaerobium]|uniref:tRNA-specific adenosine deaminase n=2 Tax=Mariniplasma anaerobium TaxID=2735436 RepID=A0A7U9XVH6_9MOLU|nr:tRNA-specific adenosine deaminase [Mariniplasma anaerobium]
MNLDQDIIMKSQENLKKYKYMRAALKEAEKAALKDEVPVGAVVVYQDKIIARAHNLRESKQIIQGHAEFLAMMKAAKKIGSWRLEDCEIYVTMEPCPMCAGAMIQSRIKKVYYGVKDYKSGVVDSICQLFELPFNHKVESEGLIMSEESEKLIKTFFKKLRQR